MYIPLLIIISILTFLNLGEKSGNFLIKNKKYVSGFLYLLSILSLLYLGSNDNHAIHETGEKALDLLWFILFLPIFAYVLNFSLAKKLMIFRKEIGILMGVLAIIHSLQYFLRDGIYWFWEYNFWFFAGEPTYLAWGFLGTIIAIILTITSNVFSMKKLGKTWKIIHRFVYILLIFTLLHVIYLKIGGRHGNEVLFETLIPLFLYIIGKILEWKDIKLFKKTR